MHLGIQISDLYRFMRKVMEKHGWNLDLGLSMLDSYERVLPMEPKERGCLYYLFLYPEKYTGNSLTFTTTPTRPGYRPGILINCRAWREQQQARNSF